jgi:hypothetical protein
MSRLSAKTVSVVLALFILAGSKPLPAGPPGGDTECVLLDDFESYPVDGLPTRWQTNKGSRELKPVGPRMMDDRERFAIMQEGGNKFVRATMIDQAHRLVFTNGNQFDWNVSTLPYLRWDWRAIRLPEGAREDESEKNDTGAAVYVTFDKDWLGRPVSIKYTYSSTLPVGTVVSYGPLKVFVVASARQDGTGQWMTIERNVAEDYRRLFGKDLSGDRPAGVMLWSDSDTIDTTSIADFDNVMLVAEPRSPHCRTNGTALSQRIRSGPAPE